MLGICCYISDPINCHEKVKTDDHVAKLPVITLKNTRRTSTFRAKALIYQEVRIRRSILKAHSHSMSGGPI